MWSRVQQGLGVRLLGKRHRVPLVGYVWIDPERSTAVRRFACYRSNYVPILRLFGYELVLDPWWGRKRYKRRGEIRIREARTRRRLAG